MILLRKLENAQRNIVDKNYSQLWDQTSMTSTRTEGKGDLKFVTCLQILLFSNNISTVPLSGWQVKGFKKLVIFCGCHKCMTVFRYNPFR